MNKFFLLLLSVFSTGLVANAADEARLLRFPATNGVEIVFSYGGDLYRVSYTGGEAQRISSHVGNEIFARFSPDGETIAFTAQYDGNTEVYTVPRTGGEPMRLTYTATNSRDELGDRMGPNNIVMTWTPDGKNIVYRNRISSGFSGKLYTVSEEGGLSTELALPEGGFCSYSPDGKLLAYNRTMREFRSWKYYKGGMADDIWIYDAKNETVTNITNNDAQDIMPMWVGEEIYFISDRDRTMNFFVYNTKTQQTSKVTNFTDYDVKFPSLGGGVIVFEKGGYIYTLDPKTKETAKVNISLKSDNIYARAKQVDAKDYITSTSMDADGKHLVLTSRGEVFRVPNYVGAVKALSSTPGAHERSAQYSPDGTMVAYISDRSGETEIYLEQFDGKAPKQLTKNNDTYIRTLSWSPDSKTIIYTDRKNRLKKIDVASSKVSTLLTNPEGEYPKVEFSPDSKWIAYTKKADNNFNVIYVYNLITKQEYPITDKWYSSSSPVFSVDGKYLVFSSERDFNPIYSSTEWNHAYGAKGGVYLALLDKNTPSPFLIDEVEDVNGESSDVLIDFEGISERIIKLPLDVARYGNFYCDGKRVYYNGNGGTRMYDLKKQEEVQIANARMTVNYGSKKALFTSGKKFYVTNIPTSKITLNDAIDLSNVKITIDYKQEWAQIFDEAWRAYRDGFYVENMHGVDWKAMKEKYAALLPYVSTRTDLNYLIEEMIGELNCGHAYVNPGQMPRAEKVSMGLLGAEVQRDKSGFFKLEKILKGVAWNKDLRSPLTEQGLNIKEGDYIVAVDGVATNTVNDIYKLLVGKADVPTELTINTQAKLDGARTVTIKPISDEYPLYHNEWVMKNIETVDKLSGGKVGYIYVPDMGVEGLVEFTRYFYPQLDKEGLIIDDRANGGGNVSPMLIERLKREVYSLTTGRGTTRVSTVPDAVHTGPKVCLINKYSASDGDLFPYRFRANELGTIIGTRTWGGIVGISGSLPYMDGTDIRVPFFTNYSPETGEWIIENHGVDPDILVDNDPIKEFKGEDEQLNRAIEEVMKELKNRKSFPKVPDPRVWNK